jgi:hypothetical protein
LRIFALVEHGNATKTPRPASDVVGYSRRTGADKDRAWRVYARCAAI